MTTTATITMYAGGPTLPVEGMPALSQPIDAPESVIPDGSGGFYVASSGQNRVYRVSANGILTVIAGTGTPGLGGDSGPAIAVQLRGPTSIALDPSGDLFIADTGHFIVRKVTPSGLISTASHCCLPTGLAVDATGNLFVADAFSPSIRKVTPAGVTSTVAGTGTCCFNGENGQATSVQLNYPSGVAVDGSGNLFIADTGNNLVREVTPDGLIRTVG